MHLPRDFLMNMQLFCYPLYHIYCKLLINLHNIHCGITNEHCLSCDEIADIQAWQFPFLIRAGRIYNMYKTKEIIFSGNYLKSLVLPDFLKVKHNILK